MSSMSSLVSAPGAGSRCASIIASRTAVVTVTSKGWGVESSTMSTPRPASSASRSSEMAEVRPRSCRPGPRARSRRARRRWRPGRRSPAPPLRARARADAAAPGAFICPLRQTRQAAARATARHPRPARGAAWSPASRARRGAAAGRRTPGSRCAPRRIRVVRSWLAPPRTTVRALVEEPRHLGLDMPDRPTPAARRPDGGRRSPARPSWRVLTRSIAAALSVVRARTRVPPGCLSQRSRRLRRPTCGPARPRPRRRPRCRAARSGTRGAGRSRARRSRALAR